MRGSIRQAGTQYVSDVAAGHRALVEKALYMRAQSYLADVKAQLLTKTIFEVDGQRRLLKVANERLADSMAALQRKKAELAVEVAWRNAIFNTESVGVLVIDDAGAVVETNRRFLGISGLKSEELEGHALAELFVDPGAYQLFLEALFDPQRQTAGVSGMEAQLRHREGGLLWCEINANVIQHVDRGKRAVCVFADISRFKEAEERIHQAREQAEAASRAKSAFLANMSHELRTPLNAILGYAKLLQTEPDAGDKRSQGLEVIERGGRHLLTLVNDILDIARIEAGRLTLEPSELQLEEFLGDLADIVRNRAAAKGVGVELIMEPGLPAVVQADEKRLRQILLNLLGNAVKFTGQGRVSLRVSDFKEASGEGLYRLSFEVQDTGIGIAADQLARIFQPFEQVGQRGHEEGTGLGLAIAKQLVEKMGGVLRVKSSPGRGSRFWFDLELPVVERPEAATQPRRDNAHRRFAGYRGPRRRLLVVDDNELNRLLMQELLVAKGFQVDLAAGGEEALERLRAGPIDLILLDILMPDMDGYAVLDALRRDPQLQGVPVIAVSAGVTDEERARAHAAAFDGFLEKPVVIAVLYGLVGDLLGLEWIDEDEKMPPEHNDGVV